MPLLAGTRLGPYTIHALLGAGGMGEVYRARDDRLQRDVAIKVLPSDGASDPTAHARLEREARAIAAVSHPHICAIHDVGFMGTGGTGSPYIVMELLEGETLLHRLQRGSFDIDTWVEHAIALSDALDAAHGRGLIHRDLKPANIFLTSRGLVKILDFGLAKAGDSKDQETRAADPGLTGPGMAVGTAAYMSPEQLRGEPLDARTDLFSLGLVLYEMATGRAAFTGNTSAAVSAAILKDEPPSPRLHRPDLPAKIEDIILKAIEKDRTLRCQSAAELRADVRRIKRHTPRDHAARPLSADAISSSGGAPAQIPTTERPAAAASDAVVIADMIRRHRVAVALALLLLGASGFAAWRLWTSRAATQTAGSIGVRPDLQMQPLTLTGDATNAMIAPDGRFVVFEKQNAGLWIQQISNGSTVQLLPFVQGRVYTSFSVTLDGSFIDFVAIEPGERAPSLWRLPFLGGTPRRLANNVYSATAWSPDGRQMAFVRLSDDLDECSVIIADAGAANERVLAKRRLPLFFVNDASNAYHPKGRPSWSSDGKSILLVGGSTAPERRGSMTELVELDAVTGQEKRVAPVRSAAVIEAAWLDETRVLENRGTTMLPGLWLSDFSGTNASPITRELTIFWGVSLTTDRRMAATTRIERRSGLWIGNASGTDAVLRVPVSSTGAGTPALDDDGGLLYSVLTGEGFLAALRLPPGSSTPVPIVPRAAYSGKVSMDRRGRVIVFVGIDPPNPLYRINSDGTGLQKLVDADAGPGTAITPDGTIVVYSVLGKPGMFSVPVSGGPSTELSKRWAFELAISPDGRQLLFSADKPGIVGLCELPRCENIKDLALPGITWAPDGKGVAYIDPKNGTNLWEQPLDGSAPRQLTRFSGDQRILDFAWSPDGRRLAVSRGAWVTDAVLIKGLQ